MFTGLIQAKGTVSQIVPTPTGARLLVSAHPWDHRPALGDSIAVSGCCLTLAADPATTRGLWAFDVIPETLSKTKLGDLKPAGLVNLEHAVTASTLMGGHFVQGHVDGVGEVTHVKTDGEWRITIRPPHHLMPFMAPKGSVCVDGVSLTLAAVHTDTFEIALIPVTLDKTTLGSLTPGNRVNLEADMIAKTIVHYLSIYAPNPAPKP